MTFLRGLLVSSRSIVALAALVWSTNALLAPVLAQETAAPAAADAPAAATEQVYLDEPTPAPEPTVAQ